MPAPTVCYSFHDLRDPAEYGGKPPENPWVVIHCPKCRTHLTANRAQYEGAVSMHHDAPYCGYHETHDLRDGTPPWTRPVYRGCQEAEHQSVSRFTAGAATPSDSSPDSPSST